MNKEKLVKELNEYVKSMSDRFEVSNDDDLDLYCDDLLVAYFSNRKKETFRICRCISSEKSKLIAETQIISKFYAKGCELLEKLNEKKYTIQVINHVPGTYLNYIAPQAEYKFGGACPVLNNKTQFTTKEIEELKQRQDVAIDWDKAIIKEVKNDE